MVIDAKGNRKENYYDEFGRMIGDYTADRVEMMYSYTDGLLTSIEKENLIGGSQVYEMVYDSY